METKRIGNQTKLKTKLIENNKNVNKKMIKKWKIKKMVKENWK